MDQDTENQISQLRKYCGCQEWEIIKVVTDNVSGAKGIQDRKGLEEVFRMAHRKQFDVLLFWSLDRLSREGSRKTIEYLSKLESYKVDWHSFTEPYLSSLGIFKDAIIAILSALAKQERVRISERTKAGMERFKRMNPNHHFGRARTSEIRINEVLQLRDQGLSLTEIGTRLKLTAARVCQISKMGKVNHGGESIKV